MVRMGTVWDRTTAFLGDRLGALTPIALLLIFVPACIQGVVAPLAGTGGEGAGVPIGLVVLVLALIMAWGQLSIVALAVEPGATAAAAAGVGGRRLLPAVGIGLLAGLPFVAAALPLTIAFVASNGQWVATAPGRWMSAASMSPGLKLFVGLYALAYVLFAFWLGARLVTLLNSVVVAERRGIGAIKRAFLLTKGLALRIIGVFVLFFVVYVVCNMAVTTVLGSVLQLLLGGEGAITPATVLTAIAGAAVAAAFTTLAAAFVAELYLAARAERDLPAEAE